MSESILKKFLDFFSLTSSNQSGSRKRKSTKQQKLRQNVYYYTTVSSFSQFLSIFSWRKLANVKAAFQKARHCFLRIFWRVLECSRARDSGAVPARPVLWKNCCKKASVGKSKRIFPRFSHAENYVGVRMTTPCCLTRGVPYLRKNRLSLEANYG